MKEKWDMKRIKMVIYDVIYVVYVCMLDIYDDDGDVHE